MSTTTITAREELRLMDEATGCDDHYEAARKILAELGVDGHAVELLEEPLGQHLRRIRNVTAIRGLGGNPTSRPARNYGEPINTTKPQQMREIRSQLLDPSFRSLTLPLGKDAAGARVVTTWGQVRLDQLVRRMDALQSVRTGIDKSIREAELVVDLLRKEKAVCLDDLAGRAR